MHILGHEDFFVCKIVSFVVIGNNWESREPEH